MARASMEEAAATLSEAAVEAVTVAPHLPPHRHRRRRRRRLERVLSILHEHAVVVVLVLVAVAIVLAAVAVEAAGLPSAVEIEGH